MNGFGGESAAYGIEEGYALRFVIVLLCAWLI